MADFDSYYMDTASFATASAVWVDATLTTKAADGYYQFDGVYRQQVSGLLLDSVACPACVTPCGGTINTSGTQGVYNIEVSLGSAVGAVVIRFDPAGIPDGLFVTYNGTTYTEVVSETHGFLAGGYLGLSTSSCVSGLPLPAPYTLNQFEYSGGSFVATGLTEDIIVTDLSSLTPTRPNSCVLVLPKLTATPDIMSIKVVGFCASTAWNIEIDCPASLTLFLSSLQSATPCSATIDQVWYFVDVTEHGIGSPQIGDWIFADQYGNNKLSDIGGAGKYRTGAGTTYIEIDSNSVVISDGTCP